MHIMGYNSEVYSTIDDAMNGVRGLVAIAVFMEVSNYGNYVKYTWQGKVQSSRINIYPPQPPKNLVFDIFLSHIHP